MPTCAKCGKTESVEEIRSCYGARPDASVSGTEDEMGVDKRGANYFLDTVNQELYDFHQRELEEERKQREAEQDLIADHKMMTPASVPGGGRGVSPNQIERDKKIYLTCPYAEKDEAKALGAMWDRNEKKWYIWKGTDEEPFSRWLLPDANPAGGSDADEGMYVYKNQVYKVIVAVHGSGHLYAKRLEVSQHEEGTELEGKPKGTFVKATGMLRFLRQEHKMSLEEAKRYGSLYGFCVRCGATLTDEGSIAAGIGPICAGKM